MGLTADLCLDGVEGRDALQRLIGDGAGHTTLVLVHLQERPSRVRPAQSLVDTPRRIDLPVAA
jgi:hypothetical protein